MIRDGNLMNRPQTSFVAAAAGKGCGMHTTKCGGARHRGRPLVTQTAPPGQHPQNAAETAMRQRNGAPKPQAHHARQTVCGDVLFPTLSYNSAAYNRRTPRNRAIATVAG